MEKPENDPCFSETIPPIQLSPKAPPLEDRRNRSLKLHHLVLQSDGIELDRAGDEVLGAIGPVFPGSEVVPSIQNGQVGLDWVGVFLDDPEAKGDGNEPSGPVQCSEN